MMKTMKEKKKNNISRAKEVEEGRESVIEGDGFIANRLIFLFYSQMI